MSSGAELEFVKVVRYSIHVPLPFCSLPVCPRDDCGEELTAEDGVKVLATSIILVTAPVLTLVVSLG